MKRIARRGWKSVVLALAIVLVPTAAFAAIGTFSSSHAAPAVMGTSSSAAAGAKALEGRQTGGGSKTRYGVLGTANGAGGVGVIGTGSRAGVYSNGTLGVRAGNTLDCTGCVTAADLASDAQMLQPLTAGETESGTFAAGGAGGGSGHIGEGITFVRPLKDAIPNTNIIDVLKWPVIHCPEPGIADVGYLCLYEAVNNDVGAGYGYSTALDDKQSIGALIFWPVSAAGDPYAGGVYTVSAP